MKNHFYLHKRYLKIAQRKKIFLDKRGVSHIGLQLDEAGRFLKFWCEACKEIRNAKEIRSLILVTHLAVESTMDLVLSKLYNLDNYRKVERSVFFKYSKITFEGKRRLLKKFKDVYRKCKRIYEPFLMPGFLMNGLFEIYGEQLFKDMNHLENDFCKKHDINLNKSRNQLNAKIDHIPEGIIRFLRKVDFSAFEKLNNYRNIIAHNWDYKKELCKKLKLTKQKDLYGKIRWFCLDLMKDSLGIVVHVKS